MCAGKVPVRYRTRLTGDRKLGHKNNNERHNKKKNLNPEVNSQRGFLF